MEDTVVVNDNGREWATADGTTAGDSGGRADDRVFAELFRMLPYDGSTVAKGVLPYAVSGASGLAEGVVQPGVPGARHLTISPIRCFVGSRVVAGTDGKKNWRDIRSCLSTPATALSQIQTLAANASGNPRWDLIYAVVAIDTNVSDTRYLKDPASKAVAAASYVVKQQTTMTLAVAQGTPGATPARPALPGDSGGNYNIPLAYVHVADSQVTFTSADIFEVAPVLNLSHATGAVTVRPASGVNKDGGSLITNQPWNNSGRPAAFMPPSMVGGEMIWVPLGILTGSACVLDNDVIDGTRDWRNRMFWWIAAATAAGSDAPFPWQSSLGAGAGTWNYLYSSQNGKVLTGVGQSFTLQGESTDPPILELTHSNLTGLASGSDVMLVADGTTGALKCRIGQHSLATPPNANIFIMLMASAPYPNP